jgi:hypothetical protein
MKSTSKLCEKKKVILLNAYEKLLDEAGNNSLIVKEKPLIANNGRIQANRIAIRETLETSTEKACILAEELGHYYTTTGNILDQSKPENRKQELHARLWAYNKQIGLRGLVDAYRSGCQTPYETAEHLGVTESFLLDAVEAYRNKYGVCTTVDNYIIYFEPHLGVMEMKS